MLVFSDVRKAYRNLEVLKGLTLSVPRGSLFGLMGPVRRPCSALQQAYSHRIRGSFWWAVSMCDSARRRQSA